MKTDALNVLEVNFAEFESEDLGRTPVTQRLQNSKYSRWLNLVLLPEDQKVIEDWVAKEKIRIDRLIAKEERDQRIKLERDEAIRRAEEDRRYTASIENIRAALREHAKRAFKDLLEKWKASPFENSERERLWQAIQTIKSITERRLPQEKLSYAGDEKYSMPNRMTREIELSIASFRERVASELAKQYSDTVGPKHFRALHEAGWKREALNEPAARENRSWKFYVTNDIDPEFEIFLINKQKEMGILYWSREPDVSENQFV